MTSAGQWRCPSAKRQSDFIRKLPATAPLSLCLLLLSCTGRHPPVAPPPESPELWYWHHSQLNRPEELQSSVRLIETAHAAGYTGVAFWDVSFTFLSSPQWTDEQSRYLRQAMDFAIAKGMKVLAMTPPFGYSNDILTFNPNWAEGQKVTGASFQVDSSGRKLRFVNRFSGTTNPGFESGRTSWFHTWWDRGVSVDRHMGHSGSQSGIIENAPGNARFSQFLKLAPGRQYHVRLFVKSRDYSGSAPVIEALNADDQHQALMYKTISIRPSQDWTQVDAAFNSRSGSGTWLYFGVWGGSAGTVWFDDITVEETPLVYLIRRTGAPLKMYAPTTDIVFREGADYDPIHDPLLTADPHDDYHQPPEVTLPATTRLRPGENVAIDYYAAQPADTQRLGLCLTDPEITAWLADNARRMMRIIPDTAGIFLNYDEMRQMNSCASCAGKGMTAGALLASHVEETMRRYRTLRPGAAFYVWNDMFDPFANAQKNYYLVQGDLAGSWRGLPSGVTIMNWNLKSLSDSLTWFSGTNRRQPIPHRQIIAGYYDQHDGASAAEDELRMAHGIPGIDGLMYTTWTSDYTQLGSFAASALRNWNDYRRSVQTNP